MKRLTVILIVLLVVGALTGAAVPRLFAFEQVYSASAVEQGLQREPGRWVGRTLLIHGMPLGEVTSYRCSSASQAHCGQTTWLQFGTAGPPVLWLQARSWRVMAMQRLSRIVKVAYPVIPISAPVPLYPLAQGKGLAQSKGRLAPPPGRVRPALGWGPVTFISVAGLPSDLTLLVRPGLHAPTLRSMPGWLGFLHGLPLVGSALQQLFPWDGGVTVRVHLTTASCAATPCANGMLVGS